jgi:HD-GYP domain-containing protein (c-di-GMP phosphodiesterase class II)/CheY-like chemotaxis protein
MLKILFFEDDPLLTERLAFVLESIAGIEVTRVTDRQQAIALLKANRTTYSLLIIDYRKGPLNHLAELQKLASSIECMICIDSLRKPPITSGWNVIAVIERASAPGQLHLHVETWARSKTTSLVDELPSNYVRIKTQLLIDISPLLSDIYVRLSERKYIKLFLEGDTFDAHDLARYAQQKKIEFMFLHIDRCHEFIHKYIVFIERQIRDAKPIALAEISVMHGSIHETVQELADKLGFTRDVQALAKSQVQLTVKTMGKKPSLKAILKHLENRSGHYSSDHCFMSGYIACAIASQLEWGSESTFHKLTLAAFMHDITLTDERVIDCETLEEAKGRHLSNEDFELFKKHPLKVAEMVRQMSEIPADVDSIIAQHHERPDGSGFPRGLTAHYLSPLAMIFMVAHDITKDVLQSSEPFSLELGLKRIQARYPQSAFKKILVAANELMITQGEAP